MPSTSLEMIAQTGRGAGRVFGRIPRYLAKLRSNPRWLTMYVLGRWMPARKAHWLAAKAPPKSSSQPTMFEGVTCEAAVQALRAEGIFRGINLPKPVADEIFRFAERSHCFAGDERQHQFLPNEHEATEERLGQAILIGNLYEKILECDAVNAVLRDPMLRDISAHYLGGQARLTGVRIFWSFPTKRAHAVDTRVVSKDEYHFDLLDWRMLKYFFYLKPVDEGAGPHIYVRNSHRRRALRHQLTPFIGHAVADVLKAYGEDKPVTLVGDAGFGFVEDPFGFHMARLAERSPRLVMEVSFGVSPPQSRGFYG